MLVDLIPITEAVPIRIGHQRIGLVQVYFVSVIQAVPIRISHIWVGLVLHRLLNVCQSIRVGIHARIGGVACGIRAGVDLHTITEAILVTVK